MTTDPVWTTAGITCLILAHEVADGAANMARDGAILDLVSVDPRAAVFRTYGWSAPTLSLGYFQPLSGAKDEPRWRDTLLVRRPTGGGAIWHDRELTYTLAVPGDHPLAARAEDLYKAVHLAIAAIMNDLGANAVRRGVATGVGGSDRPFLCFADQHPDDIVIGGHKVVGSAQRRRKGAVLQHGSILLGSSERTPELLGAAELSDAPDDPMTWAGFLRQHVPRSLGFHSEPTDWTGPLLERAEILEREIYRNPLWTARR